jgi:hypothetical protein
MKKIFVFCVIAGLMVGACFATPVIGDASYWGNDLQSYSYGPSVNDIDGLSFYDVSATSGRAVTFGFTGPGNSPTVMLGSTADNFSGNFGSKGSSLGVKFTFSTQTLDVYPAQLNLYFVSGGNYYISTWHEYFSTTGSSTFNVDIASAANWQNMDNFTALFSSVTEFGFEVAGASYSGLQEYQIQDVEFTVPEPETVWMILMVLASLGITFRSRLMDLAGQVKARIRA